jgi:putative peptidoglycan lipid II flippase
MLNKKSIGVVGLINGLSTLLGLFYSVVLARYFGIGSQIEVYFAATTLLFMINSLSQSGQLAEIVLPVYHKYQNQEGQESANQVMSVVFNWMGLMALVFTLVSFLFAPQLFYASASGFDPAQLEEGTRIFRIIAPLIFVEIMKAQISSMVNAEKRFGKIEWVNILNQLASMGSIVLLTSSLSVYAAVIGLWIGEILALGYGIYVLSKTNFRYHFLFRKPGFKVLSVLGNMTYTFGYVVVTQSYLFYMNNLLTHLPQGTYAIYKYAMLIFTKIQGLLVRPVSVIFFSQFSSAYHSGSEKIRHLVEETSRLGFILSTLVFAGILACGDPMLRLLWEGDTFETGAIHQVYTTLCIVSVAMFLNAIALLYRKIVMTLGKIREQYLAYIAVQLVSAGALFLLRDHIILETILLVFLLNTLFLSSVPVVLTRKYAGSGIPVSLGSEPLKTIFFFLALVALAYFIGQMAQARFAGQPAWLVLLVSGFVFVAGLGAFGWAFRLAEWEKAKAFLKRPAKPVS